VQLLEEKSRKRCWTADAARIADAGSDPASKVREGGRFQYLVVKSHYGFTTVTEMKYTSQHCCDKIDGKMVLNREFCFPNCTKSWWIEVLS